MTEIADGALRLRRIIAAVVAATLVASASATAEVPDAEIALIKNRLVAHYLAAGAADAEHYLASQDAEGGWRDINYADRSLAWSPQKHLDRLRQMAVAYREAGGGAAALRDSVLRGIAFWYRAKPRSDDWWHNEIGQQLALEPILVLMAEDLPPELAKAGIADLHDPVELASHKFTGENLVWCADEQLVRGVLRRSGEDITAALRAIASTAAVTTETEGIQYDHSFHQHGPQLYVGGYGLNLLNDATTTARLVQGTRFAFGAEEIKGLSDYLLDGTRLMVRGKMLDPGAIGREITRPGLAQEAPTLLPALDNMAILDAGKKAEYQALRSHIDGTGAPQSFLGHKHFWDSDFTVHERAQYYASVKMVSNRTYGTEKVNGENQKGYWLPFGLTYIARRGDEYLDVFPAWDWAHLPGVTSPEEVPRFLSHVDQPDAFVGGVSDGVYGAAAMQVDVEGQTSLHARKAWFFFDDEFVALGAGISSRSGAPVTTTLNQSLLRGDVIVDGHAVPSGSEAGTDVSWVLHDGVGYVFPQRATASVRTGPRTGSWAEINALQAKTPVTKDVFALWLDHRARPQGASYQYIVVPATSATRLADYARRIPVRVLANTADLQAVRHERLGITEIIFHSAGGLSLDEGLDIVVDQPCMILLKEAGATNEVAASAPRGPLELHVLLRRGGKIATAVFDLRGGPSLGASQIRRIASP
jgi:chondroitin AC lyase